MNYQNYYDSRKAKEAAAAQKSETELAEENRKLKMWLGIAIGSTVFAGLGCYYCWKDTQACKALISEANAHVKRISSINVNERVVENAVNKATKEAADKAVYSATQSVFAETKAEIRAKVKAAVEASMAKVTDAVAVKMAKEVADISRDDIIEDVVKATTEKLSDKLEEELGDEMSKVGEIYKNIVEALN